MMQTGASGIADAAADAVAGLLEEVGNGERREFFGFGSTDDSAGEGVGGVAFEGHRRPGGGFGGGCRAVPRLQAAERATGGRQCRSGWPLDVESAVEDFDPDKLDMAVGERAGFVEDQGLEWRRGIRGGGRP